MPRPCLDCLRPSRWARCPECEHARRTMKYGAAHVEQRIRWDRLIDAGEVVVCSRHGSDPDCPGLINQGDDWQLDHLDDGSEWPAHRTCNERAHVIGRAK